MVVGDYGPDIIGIFALFTPSYQNMFDIAQCCHDIFSNAVIVAGGGVPANVYKGIFSENACLDALCYGESEKSLLGLVKTVDKLWYLEENPSCITREKVASGQFIPT